MRKYRKKVEQCVEEKKENIELKSVKVDVVTNFIKDEVESFSDTEVYTDEDNSEEDRVIGFK